MDLANHEIVVIAALLAGADTSPADTEDVAMKANAIAPGRFVWRKYVDQINIEAVRKRLWDASKEEKGGYLVGSEKLGWRLTKAGFDFASKHIDKIAGGMAAKVRTSQPERAVQVRELRRMLSDEAFVMVTSGKESQVSKDAAERFFRLDDYVTGKSRTAKIERFRIIARGNPELERAILALAQLVKEL